MDRSRRRPGVLIGAAALALAAAAPAAPPLKAMRWLAPGADASAILTLRPAECLRAPTDSGTAYSVELGRAAFRTPLLLGGQAARAGVACETCHQNGRANVNFDFPGLSGVPGTADVTSSLFSSHRGDGVDNPRPIPDLGGPKSALKVSQDRASPALEAFIHGLVTQEFDGAEPPPTVLRGLADYVRSMDPAACPATSPEHVTAVAALADARRAAFSALAAIQHDDTAAAVVMIQSTRSQVGAIYERFAGADLAPVRQSLALADLDLRAAEDALRQGRSDRAEVRLTAWLAELPPVSRAVRDGEGRSLYNPAVLSRAAHLALP